MTAPWDKGEWVKGVAHWREGDTAFISVSFTRRLPEGAKVGQLWHVIRDWPVYGKASHVCILTAVNPDGSGELSTFQRPSRGYARHLRSR